MDNRNRKNLINLSKDIYFQKEYLSLYLNDEDEIFEFEFNENGNSFYSISIKKPIKKIGKKLIDEDYFDLETAYGYGGIISNSSDKLFLDKATSLYEKKCASENIIAEFSRIHAFNDTHKNIHSYYDLLINDRQTVTVDCTVTKEDRWLNYPSKIRTILRKCDRDLTFEQTEDVDSFIRLYELTMSKNNASEFYYFDRKYFDSLLAINNVELYVVKEKNNVIAASFFMFGESIGHYHLSANDYDYRKFNANYFILDSIFDIAREKGMRDFHLGGGRSNTEDDLLLRFKSKFSSLRKEFYLGGKIFNTSKFTEYNNLWKKNSENDIPYFLKYRLP